MEGNLEMLVVHGFAVREGKGKWACCYEIRLAGEGRDCLLYRGELHGKRFDTEQAAIAAAREAGEYEARRHMESLLAALPLPAGMHLAR